MTFRSRQKFSKILKEIKLLCYNDNMKRNLIITFIIILVLIISYFVFFYRSDFQVCLVGKLCTADIRPMCNPATGEYRTESSSCSCGIDAGVLEGRGWIDCPEKLRE